MNQRKLTAGILLLCTLCASSCAGTDTPSQATETKSETAVQTETETETKRLYANVEYKDYGGITFDILTAGNWNNAWTEIYDFQAEEENGEPINDAVYTRNLIIEDRFNVKITEINHMGMDNGGGTGNGAKMIEKSVMAADNAYDASLMGAYDVSTLSYNNYLLDLSTDVPYIDLSQPWWDQKANTDLAMMGKLFY
ncbi:MAG: hypothetical protein ACI3XM_09190, partial [Eubacteriales bacterium]